jgi:uncharacterized phage-associated protein
MEDIYEYKSEDVARYIAAYANEHKYVINMTKIQKLLYIAYGVYLAIKDKRLTNEHPQAWPYGPVFPITRNKLSKEELTDISFKDPQLQKMSEDVDFSALIKLVFKVFGSKTAGYLSEWSHMPGSPWDAIVKSEKFKWGDRIDDIFIKEYFVSIIVK